MFYLILLMFQLNQLSFNCINSIYLLAFLNTTNMLIGFLIEDESIKPIVLLTNIIKKIN